MDRGEIVVSNEIDITIDAEAILETPSTLSDHFFIRGHLSVEG